MARQRDPAGKDVQQVSMIKDSNRNVPMKTVLRGWKKYFEKINEGNESERVMDGWMNEWRSKSRSLVNW